jgi:hypothetical protein
MNEKNTKKSSNTVQEVGNNLWKVKFEDGSLSNEQYVSKDVAEKEAERYARG